MDNLQYIQQLALDSKHDGGFKPYYKWITFNTLNGNDGTEFDVLVKF